MPEIQETTRMERAGKEVGVELRHNRVQKTLFAELAEAVGPENVGAEVDSGSGGRVDVVARDEGSGLTFYEIKVGRSPGAYIRDAIGQLLEYSLWPGSERPERLVVVGEEEIGLMASRYLERLNSNLSFSVEYRRRKCKSS
ncbi:MAG: hypothetical protein ABEL04_15040 [Salinibacter sp.]|uniref:hypothetical protein n=1 Tax=Salinibacter sp. TaxID=2065818 RepID=UPI0035D4B5D7